MGADSGRGLALSVLVAAPLALAASPASAWTCTATESGICLTWRSSCVSWSMAEQDLDNGHHASPVQPLIPFEELHRAVAASFETWDMVDCSYIDLIETDPMHCLDVGYHASSGNANRVFFRSTGWLDPDAPWREPGQVALTSVYYDTGSGQIFDVDIEINAEEFELTTTDDRSLVRTDVQNALTHEVGHLLGLGHSTVPTATMDSSTVLGEIDKRLLDPDDLAGICATYPLAEDPGTCEGPAGGLDLECGNATWCAESIDGITLECSFDETVCCCGQAGGFGGCGWDDWAACRTSERHAVFEFAEREACPGDSPGPAFTCCCTLRASGVSCSWARSSHCDQFAGVPAGAITTVDLCGAPPETGGCACAVADSRRGVARRLIAILRPILGCD